MLKKFFVYLLVITAPISVPISVGAQPTLQHPTALKDALLVEVLNGGEMQDLNKLGPANHKELAIRLYSVAHAGTCVEETEWVCSYRYVLAVSEYDEEPAQAAYDLGEVGEIGAIRWLETADPDRAHLEIEVRNYPEHADKQNPSLKVKKQRYRLSISVSDVTVSRAE